MSRSDIVHELYKPARKNFPRRKTVLKGINDLIQFDLMEMQQLAKENSNYRYILAGINCFRKKGFAEPIKNKQASTTAQASEKILNESQLNFQHCQTDLGSEFKGDFAKLMQKRHINHYSTNSETKASIH